MSNILKHAERELELIGYTKDCIPPDNTMRAAILELLKVFADQRHSGSSAAYCIDVFSTLARQQILSPLTGADDEWGDVGEGLYQNKRDPRVFKRSDGAYFVDAIVWCDKEDGNQYTNWNSRRKITLPFTPKTFYVDVDDGVINKAQLRAAEAYYNTL